MKLSATCVAVLAALQGSLAVDVQKSVIVTYDSGAPDSIVAQAMDAIRAAGGVITHEYKLIRYVLSTTSGLGDGRKWSGSHGFLTAWREWSRV